MKLKQFNEVAPNVTLKHNHFPQMSFHMQNHLGQ